MIEELEKVRVFAFADKLLQSKGDPSRYAVHPGDPDIGSQSSNSVEAL
jgi:hypothetical protein